VRKNLLSFYALTDCDTTLVFSCHRKRSCWKTFQKHPLLSGELVMMESSHYLKRLCVTHMANRNSQPSTMPDFSCFVRPRKVWRCCFQIEMPWNFRQYVPTTRQRSGCKEHIDVPPQLSPRLGRRMQSLDKTPTIPGARVELVTCSCLSKCNTA